MYERLTQTKVAIMKGHVSQCDSVAHLFNSLWTTMEVYGTEDYSKL